MDVTKTPRPFRTALTTSAIISGMVGGLVFCGSFLADWDADRIIGGLTVAANTTAVAFWILFALALSYQARETEIADERELLTRRNAGRR